MGLPTRIPGLDLLAPEIPDGRLVVIEGGTEPTQGFLARHLAQQSASESRPVTLLTSQEADDLPGNPQGKGRAARVAAGGAWEDVLREADRDQDLIVDSFSFFAQGVASQDLAPFLRTLRRSRRQGGRVAVLTLERGMLSEGSASLARHMADGVLEFHRRDDLEGSVPYLRIPKWMGGELRNKNVYYHFDGHEITIDMRKRVV